MTTYTFDLIGELAQIEPSVWIYGPFALIWAAYVPVVALGYLQGCAFRA